MNILTWCWESVGRNLIQGTFTIIFNECVLKKKKKKRPAFWISQHLIHAQEKSEISAQIWIVKSEKCWHFGKLTSTSRGTIHFSCNCMQSKNKLAFPLWEHNRNPHKWLDRLCCSSEKKLDIIANGVARERPNICLMSSLARDDKWWRAMRCNYGE